MAILQIEQIDHLVMYVENVEATVRWYQRVLGIKSAVFGEGRTALLLNKQKINVYPKETTVEPRARNPVPGSLDVCLIFSTSLATVIEHLKAQRVPIEKGPIKRNGASGLITSIYIRDPDSNLIEVSNPG